MFYENQIQNKIFNLHTPRQLIDNECRVLKIHFPKFICHTSYILAESSWDYNCIGWGIGVKRFIDPRVSISAFYNTKFFIDIEINLSNEPIILFDYKRNQSDCIQAVTNFYNLYKNESVLSEVSYLAKDSLLNLPKNNTIAFYFKECTDTINNSGQLDGCGISHAARYIEEKWVSKFGSFVLATHNMQDLSHGYYGEILCYLEPI